MDLFKHLGAQSRNNTKAVHKYSFAMKYIIIDFQ